MRIVIREQFHTQSYGIWLFDTRLVGNVTSKFVGKPNNIEFVEMSDRHTLPEPTFTIDSTLLSGLIDSGRSELELSGLAERLGSSSLKEIQAIKDHLKDMQKIAFSKIGV